MALLKGFCCCLNLKQGTIVIGFFCLVSIIGFYVIVRLLGASKNLAHDKGLTSIYSFGAISTPIGVLVLLLLIPASIFLLIGASKGYKVFLTPWIITFSLFITLFSAYMIMIMIKLTGLILGGVMFILAVFFLSALAFEVYLLAVVISLYQELNNYQTVEGNNPGKIYSGPNYLSNERIFVVSYVLGNEAA